LPERPAIVPCFAKLRAVDRFLPLLALAIALALPGIAMAQLCPSPRLVVPDDFPTQPINILIPRNNASGALRLNAQMAAAIESLDLRTARGTKVEMRLLFKFGGDTRTALEAISALPANGYNIVQLNDTYAALLAGLPQGQAPAEFVPINLAQISLSQIYIRTNDPRFSDLQGFMAYAARPDTPALRIANFDAGPGNSGLEDILLERFAASNGMSFGAEHAQATQPQPAGDAPLSASDTAQGAAQGFVPGIVPVGFERASERYFSLFDARPDTGTDALIEQPGDVARLLDGGLIAPIFTLLPEGPESAELRAPLADIRGFSDAASHACPMLYRYRGFFVPASVPEDRRRFLEALFLAAFDTDVFQTLNREEYMDLLYPDPEIRQVYCEVSQARRFFERSVADYRSCAQAGQPVLANGAISGPDE